MSFRYAYLAVLAMFVPFGTVRADEPPRDPTRDILVTFVNAATRGGVGAPYRNRKRYRVGAETRRHAAELANDYQLVAVDSWPIRSLAVYCVLYRLPEADNRAEVIERLRTDDRVESVQPVQTFEVELAPRYDDTYFNLQHGIATMSVWAAHRHSVGKGVRIAIVDSDVDRQHEDLRGRLDRVKSYAVDEASAETSHGTAIASVIGANANNAKGIVGVAPGAGIDVYAACWASATEGSGVCDSYSLAKALDTLLRRPPDIVNLSLSGPHDALLARLLVQLHSSGAVLVAALANELGDDNHFPASLPEVLAVSSSSTGPTRANLSVPDGGEVHGLFAPGQQILVAVPDNRYDFRSGSSIAAAHVSGVVALLLSDDPDLSSKDIEGLLKKSQTTAASGLISVNACAALKIIDAIRDCS